MEWGAKTHCPVLARLANGKSFGSEHRLSALFAFGSGASQKPRRVSQCGSLLRVGGRRDGK
jgi:hypothetical protein